jgi:hypothetical protein
MAYITTEEVREIRNELKEKFGKRGFKFSVRNSNKMEVIVSIKSGKTDFSDLWADKKEGDYGFGYAQINHYHLHNWFGYAQINHYHLHNYGEHAELFREIEKVIKTAPAKAKGGREWYDESDIQSDYFNTAFYFTINVGSWDNPYIKQ